MRRHSDRGDFVQLVDLQALVLVGDVAFDECDRHEPLARAHGHHLVQQCRGIDDGLAGRALECERIVTDSAYFGSDGSACRFCLLVFAGFDTRPSTNFRGGVPRNASTENIAVGERSSTTACGRRRTAAIVSGARAVRSGTSRPWS
jgi:hypothetical protein